MLRPWPSKIERRQRWPGAVVVGSLLLLLGMMTPAWAAPQLVLPGAPGTACWLRAARYQDINPWLLAAIGWVESKTNPNAIHYNTDGSIDVGVMQINSSWNPALLRYGITPSDLRNPCTSVYIGAWVLRQSFNKYGDSWRAIAAYNTGSVDTPAQYQMGLNYARRVYAAYASLIQGRVPG